MSTDELNEISENIILKNQNLMDYYLHFYNRYFFTDKNEWNKKFNKNELINLLELISLTNNKKIRIYSIIQHDLDAFKSLINESEILNNDEEIKTYMNIIYNNEMKYDDLKSSFTAEIYYLRREIEINFQREIEELRRDIKELTYSTNKIRKGCW